MGGSPAMGRAGVLRALTEQIHRSSPCRGAACGLAIDGTLNRLCVPEVGVTDSRV